MSKTQVSNTVIWDEHGICNNPTEQAKRKELFKLALIHSKNDTKTETARRRQGKIELLTKLLSSI